MGKSEKNKKNKKFLGNAVKVSVVAGLVGSSLTGIGVPVEVASADTNLFDSTKVNLAHFEFTEVEGGLSVKATSEGRTASSIHVPAQVDGKNVIAISDNGFKDTKGSAIYFEDSSLIETVGAYAFQNSTATNEISLPNITKVPDYAFSYSKFSAINLEGDKITEIGIHAFSGTKATHEISLPNITKVPISAFSNSTFSAINIDGAKITEIGSHAFESTKVTHEISLPNITKVPQGAFSSSTFSTINIDGDKITAIGDYAFNGAKATNEISLPNITTIPSYAFKESNFTAIHFDGAKISSIGEHAFYDAKATNEISLPNITNIPYMSFLLSKFTAINLDGEKITEIGESAFGSASATNEISLPNITKIPNTAFSSSSFSAIHLDGAKITEIGKNAFQNVKATNELSLPNITSIPQRAFSGSNFTAIYLDGEKITSLDNYAFDGAKATNELSLPNITKIPDYAFQSSQFKTLDFGSGEKITTIGYRVFKDTQATNGVSFPNVTLINPYTFENSNFETINFGDVAKVLTVHEFAFSGAKATNEIDLPKLTSINQYAFADSSFKSISFGSGEQVTTVAMAAFKNAKATNEISLPNITVVPQSFFDNSNFSAIHLNSDKITTVGASAFKGVKATNEISLLNIRAIPAEAFAGASFTKVNLTLSKLSKSAVVAGAFTRVPELTLDQEFKDGKFIVTVFPTSQTDTREIRYGVGEKTAGYFANSNYGRTVDTSTNRFELTESGTYTVYFCDIGMQKTAITLEVVMPLEALNTTLSGTGANSEKLQAIVDYVTTQDTDKGTQLATDVTGLNESEVQELITGTLTEVSKTDVTDESVVTAVISKVADLLAPTPLEELNTTLSGTGANSEKLQAIVDFVTAQDTDKGTQLETDVTGLNSNESKAQELITATLTETSKADATNESVVSAVISKVETMKEATTNPTPNEPNTETSKLDDLKATLTDDQKTVTEKLQAIVDFVKGGDTGKGTQLETDIADLTTDKQEEIIADTVQEAEKSTTTEESLISRIIDFVTNLLSSGDSGTGSDNGTGTTDGGTGTDDGTGSTDGGTGSDEGTGSTDGGTGSDNGTGGTDGGTGTDDGTGSTDGGTGTDNGTGSTDGGTGSDNGTGSTDGGTGTDNGTGSTDGGTGTDDGTGSTDGGTGSDDGNTKTPLETLSDTLGDVSTTVDEKIQSIVDFITGKDAEKGTEASNDLAGMTATEKEQLIEYTKQEIAKDTATEESLVDTIVGYIKDLISGTGTDNGTGTTGGGSGSDNGTGTTGGGSGSDNGTGGSTGGGSGSDNGTGGSTGGGSGSDNGTGTTGGGSGSDNGTGGSTGGGSGSDNGTGGSTGGGSGSDNGTGGSTVGNTSEGTGTNTGTDTGTSKPHNSITTDVIEDIFEDLDGQTTLAPTITFDENIKAIENKTVDTLIITEDKVQVEIAGEIVDVAKFEDLVAVSDLYAFRLNEGQISTVMQENTGDSLIINTQNGYENIKLTNSRGMDFVDVGADDWFANDVEELYNLYIVNGTTATTYSPNSDLTRGQFASMIARSLELSIKDYEGEYALNDLDGKWYANDVAHLTDLGIITGHLDGSFRGSDKITRQQAVTMVGRAMEYLGVEIQSDDILDFKDGHKIHDYAKPYVDYLADNDVVQSGSDVTFNPKENITRAQMSKVLLRALQLTDKY